MPLDSFYKPSEVRLLEEQLYNGLVTPQWAHPLVAFFAGRKVEHIHFERIVYAAKRLAQRQLSISALAHEVNLSDRQFGRVFRQIIGLPPKHFSRILRLNRVLNSPDYNAYGMSLEQLANRHGYHDPSHLVREFQELAGMSPVGYFSGNHDLIEQKFREHDRFVQWEPDMLSMSSKT
jgi:transcriptional regulator GlxA family with amidase domain